MRSRRLQTLEPSLRASDAAHPAPRLQMRAILLMSMLLLALSAPPCFAQADGAAAAGAKAQAPGSAAGAGQEPVPVPQKSAFGRVMGVRIAALLQESTQESRSPETRASDATPASQPINIEVGEAFRPAVAAATSVADENAVHSSDVASTASPHDSDADAGGVASQATEPFAVQGDGQ
jgi:hypothetical protein